MYESKFIRLNENLLLEWVFDDDNIKQENYQVLNNLQTGIRSFMSTQGLNTIDNTLFPIDPIIKKYALVDTGKYNFLKLENYSTSLTKYDKLRLHLPVNYSFYDNNYIGYYLRVYTYNYDNSKQINLSNFFYNETELNSYKLLTLNEEFIYDNIIWGKYITFDIPSIDTVSKQRTNTNDLIPNSINANLTRDNGVSPTSKTPDYQDLGVNIREATDGDYFEIFGTYNGQLEEIDNYMSDLIAKGRKPRLEFVVSLFEENILQYSKTFVVTDNFSQILIDRPVIRFSNTTAMIQVTMNIIDSVDNSQSSRIASYGLTSELFKYGKKLSRINLDNAFKPKIYNLKTSNNVNNITTENQIPDINITKVNYPVITDRVKILVSSSQSQNSDYKPMGLAELILNPFDNFIKFLIASDIDGDGNATPMNLSDLLQNSKLNLIFKSDTDFLEKEIFQETDQNDFNHGIIVYKIEEDDITTIKKISTNNKDFYLTIKAINNTRTMLYSGKFVTFDEVKFVDNGNGGATGFNPQDLADLINSMGGSNNVNPNQLADLLAGSSNINNNIPTNQNALVFLNLDANVGNFETYLNNIKANIFAKRAGGNSSCGAYIYFILNLTTSIMNDIKNQIGVKEVIGIPFNVGQTASATQGVSADDIKNRVLAFNCTKK